MIWHELFLLDGCYSEWNHIPCIELNNNHDCFSWLESLTIFARLHAWLAGCGVRVCLCHTVWNWAIISRPGDILPYMLFISTFKTLRAATSRTAEKTWSTHHHAWNTRPRARRCTLGDSRYSGCINPSRSMMFVSLATDTDTVSPFRSAGKDWEGFFPHVHFFSGEWSGCTVVCSRGQVYFSLLFGEGRFRKHFQQWIPN